MDNVRSISAGSDGACLTPGDADADVGDSSRARACWGWLCVHACSHAGLATLVVAYSLLGAVLFELVEGGGTAAGMAPRRHEDGKGAGVQRSREDCLRELWTITERLNVLYERNWTRLVHEQLRKFESNIVAATQSGGHLAGGHVETANLPDNEHQHWSFGGALLYSVTVITTIGYGNLSPRTALGKVLTMIYAAFGVPLMLLCLSSLGQLLARLVHCVYARIACRGTRETVRGTHAYSHKYQRASTGSCTASHDTALIQLATPHKTPNNPQQQHHQIQPHTPRKSAHATVNASHTRGRCRLLSAERTCGSPARPPPIPECSAHVSLRPEPPDNADTDETDDAESGQFPHDTPSRIPLIWRDDSKPPTPSPQDGAPREGAVPVLLVVVVLAAYLCLGAFAFSTWQNWTLLDATYFCFITLSTIGFGDLVPGEGFQYGHLQLVACSAYLVVGLVLVAMSFSLIHDEVIRWCKTLARAVGIHAQ